MHLLVERLEALRVHDLGVRLLALVEANQHEGTGEATKDV